MAGRPPRNPKQGSIGQLTSRVGQMSINPGPRPFVRTEVIANYFPIDLSRLKKIYSYKITLKGTRYENASRRMKRQAILSFITQNEPPVKAATDYNDSLITVEPLPESYIQGEKTFMYVDQDDPPQGRPGVVHSTVEIKFKRELEISRLMAYLSNPQTNPGQFTTADKDDFTNFLNILFNHYPSQKTHFQLTPSLLPKVAQVGAFKFFSLENNPDRQLSSGALMLGRGLEARNGFFRSVRCASNRHALMNINRVTAPFYLPIQLSKLIMDFRKYTTGPPRNPVNNSATISEVSMFIKGLRVKTTHFSKSKMFSKASNSNQRERIYTVRGLANDRNPTAGQVTFEWERDGKKQMISVAKYFKEQHGLQVNADSYVVVVGYLTSSKPDSGDLGPSKQQSKKSQPGPTREIGGKKGPPPTPIYLPAEYCEVIPGQSYKKLLSREQTATIIKFAAKSPEENRTEIQRNGLQMFGITTRDTNGPLANFGLKLSTSMLEVNGRLLQPPSLSYKNNKSISQEQTRLGKWNLKDVQFASSGNIATTWSILQTSRGYQDIDPESFGIFFKEFKKAMSTYGINNMTCWEQSGNNYASHRLLLKEGTESDMSVREARVEAAIHGKFHEFVNSHRVKMLFVFIDSKTPDLYSFIKRIGDVKLGLITICAVTQWNFDRNNGQKWWGPKTDPTTMANYMMKVNLKLGGTNQKLPEAIMPWDFSRTMFMGMDVTHPGPLSLQGAPSIATVVATAEGKLLGQWPASIRTQFPDPDKLSKEIIEDLKAMVIERLNLWKAKNGSLPERLITYRDGVSESQFDLVLQHEVPQIRAAFQHIYGENGPHPKLLHMCAIKRHHTRLYPKNNNPRILDQKTKNFLPGLIVDESITYETGHDWFMQSQAALQGTAVPTHYKVIENDLANQVSIEKIQQMTHDMCFIFGRCTKSVSIHPAAYYADLACERVRVWMRRAYTRYGTADAEDYDPAQWDQWVKPHEKLTNCMWYI